MQIRAMRITVLGTGYVGLVAGAGFAQIGNEVSCVDVDEQKIARLRRGDIPIHEPGLEELVKENLEAGRLHFTTDVAEAVRDAQVVLIAVGTPPAKDGSADLSHVLSAAEAVGRSMTGYLVVATKSTVPIGTSERIADAIRGVTDQPFAVASNPEFLKEGDAINDFMKPDRVIIGCSDERAVGILRRLYAPFVRTSDRILVMDPRSAELTKYAANAYLATRVSFMNDIANLCEHLGADVEWVRRGMGTDRRIGPKFLFPGCGYGGSCFPKDVRAVMTTAMQVGTQLGILEQAHRVNERQKEIIADRIERHFGGRLRGKTVAIWGLAFKPGTDDTREAPALCVIDRLLRVGAQVQVHDPAALDAVERQYGTRLGYFADPYRAARGAHALALMTEWQQLRRPNFARVKELMAEPSLFDGRNVWDPDEVRALGFQYYAIGRPGRSRAAYCAQ
jgi:UDPglucose 6-dehydrogenase